MVHPGGQQERVCPKQRPHAFSSKLRGGEPFRHGCIAVKSCASGIAGSVPFAGEYASATPPMHVFDCGFGHIVSTGAGFVHGTSTSPICVFIPSEIPLASIRMLFAGP